MLLLCLCSSSRSRVCFVCASFAPVLCKNLFAAVACVVLLVGVFLFVFLSGGAGACAELFLVRAPSAPPAPPALVGGSAVSNGSERLLGVAPGKGPRKVTGRWRYIPPRTPYQRQVYRQFNRMQKLVAKTSGSRTKIKQKLVARAKTSGSQKLVAREQKSSYELERKTSIDERTTFSYYDVVWRFIEEDGEGDEEEDGKAVGEDSEDEDDDEEDAVGRLGSEVQADDQFQSRSAHEE